MLSSALHASVRSIARDSGRGASTTARFYSAAQISNALIKARQDTIEALFDNSDLAGHSSFTEYLTVSGASLPIQRPRITIAGIMQVTPFTSDGQAVPADYWRIECGSNNLTFGYIKAEAAALAEMMANTWEKTVYVKNNAFFGQHCTAYYWAVPTTTLDDDATDLNAGTSALNDAFYNTAKYRALAYMIAKEKGDKDSKVQLCNQIWQRRLATLR